MRARTHARDMSGRKYDQFIWYQCQVTRNKVCTKAGYLCSKEGIMGMMMGEGLRAISLVSMIYIATLINLGVNILSLILIS